MYILKFPFSLFGPVQAKRLSLLLRLFRASSKIERDLVSCCEVFDENGLDNEDREGIPGTLDKKHEVKFVGLMTNACKTLSSRGLAIAILERTIDAHLYENEPGDLKRDDCSDDGKESDSSDENEEAEQLKQMAKDEEWDPGSHGIRRSLRNRNKINPQQKPKTRKKIVNVEVAAAENDSVERLDAFMVSGGLKVLSRWLSSSLHVHVMRPLVLPILRVLEYIPFNKKLVMESKINKQIKKLGKHIDALLHARSKGRNRKEDNEGWIALDDDDDETDPLVLVKETVSVLKRTWEEAVVTKQVEITVDDPFISVKEKVRARLDSLLAYEAGTIARPDWFVVAEKPKKKESKKRSKPVRASKLNVTQTLAAKERLAEREEIQKRLKNAVSESRERLTKLREQIRKRRGENLPTSALDSKPKKVKVGKRVRWKDGLTQKYQCNRKLLEEVFIFHSYKHDEPKSGESNRNSATASRNNLPIEGEAGDAAPRPAIMTYSGNTGASNLRVMIDPSNSWDDPSLL